MGNEPQLLPRQPGFGKMAGQVTEMPSSASVRSVMTNGLSAESRRGRRALLRSECYLCGSSVLYPFLPSFPSSLVSWGQVSLCSAGLESIIDQADLEVRVTLLLPSAEVTGVSQHPQLVLFH